MSRLAILLFVVLLTTLPEGVARAAWQPGGVDLSRPRLLFHADEVAGIQAKLDRRPLPVPLVQVWDRMDARIAAAAAVPLDDHRRGPEREKARAARHLAFFYAIDRTRIGGEVVPFPDPAARDAVGARVHELLLHMYTRSRLAVDPPLGGFDRDITTSEEIINYATAYDALLGAGYDFGADAATIENNLVDLTSELYDNYVNPETADFAVDLHQNNHRSKTGSALVVGAVALAEYTPADGSDPREVREPTLWLEFGLDQLDEIWRHILVTGDGAYGEGPFYWRFTSQNLLPFARAWDRLVGGADWPARGGAMVPSPWRHPLLARMSRWMLDMTFPSGALVHIDDGNPGRSYYFAAAPLFTEDAPHFLWRYANAPSPYEIDGNIELGPDVLINFDPEIVPAPPTGSPTAFYLEGGDAIFRSDWSPEAVMAVVVAEYDTAASMGRDRSGLGRGPQSHEHAEPGSFMLHAFEERLALDPGYLSFGERLRLNQPEDHNMILVDGRGPTDPLGSTLGWALDPVARPIADGQARLSHPLDTDFLDAVRTTARYGNEIFSPYEQKSLVQRHFLFADDRYLIAADRVSAGDAVSHPYTWLLHGNAGGLSGGSYADTSLGGRWTREKARLDVAFAFDTGAPVMRTRVDDHEENHKTESTHVVLEAEIDAVQALAVEWIYPSRTSDDAPEMQTLAVPGGAGLLLAHADEDRLALAWHRNATEGEAFGTADGTGGIRATSSDGSVALFDTHLDGSLRLAYAQDATELGYDGVTLLSGDTPGRLGIGVGPDRAEVLADSTAAFVSVAGLAFAPQTADGACALDTSGVAPRVRLGRERRFVLRADAGNARPAADPGPDQRVPVGSEVVLDGSASCDADGDELTPRWKLVSSPPRGSWRLEDVGTWNPRLFADVAGPHRVELRVTDAQGNESRPVQVLVMAGFACADGVDDDLDGMIDSDDPACAHAPGIVEDPACDNGADDDSDGLVDFAGGDPECRTPFQVSEAQPRCGLGGGTALAVLLAMIAAGRFGRGRRTSR